jgi:hypothetical protein
MLRTFLMTGTLCALLLGGCGTMNAARPLEAGEHRLGFNFGGPFTTSLGPPIPIPNLVVEGRSGLKPLGTLPIDLNYGLNMTTFAFGVTGFHTGASLHVLEQNGAWPALSVTERVHVYNNVLGSGKPKETQTWWGLNEFDLTASWLAGHHILYVGMSDALDMGDPEWLISPFFGTELRPKGGRFAWQLESRWLGANFSPDVYDVSWLNTGDPGHGLFTFTVGASWKLGAGGPS